MKPPVSPTRSEMMLRKNSMTTAATTRGVTSFFEGSTPMARMASICSVTFMEPSSLAMPLELRPATIKSGQHRSQLAHHRERYQLAGQRQRTELLQRAGGLQRQHSAGEEAGQHHDGQRAYADQVGLQQRVRRSIGAA